MRDMLQKYIVLLLLAALLIASVTGGCAPAATPTPTPAEPTEVPTAAATTVLPTELPTQLPTELPTGVAPLGQLTLLRPFIVEDQVIVTGPKVLVELVVNAVSGAASLEITADPIWDDEALDVFNALCPIYPLAQFEALPELERTQRLSLWYLEDVLDECGALPQHEALWLAEREGVRQDEWVMDLYNIINVEPSSELLAAEVVAAINCLAAQRYGAAPLVLADPVYRTGDPPTEGHPWIGEGSPWIGEGSEIDRPAGAANKAFWGQWAFLGFVPDKPGGIDLMRYAGVGDSIPYTRTVASTGQGIRVGVFDSSPFTQAGPVSVDWVTPTLVLTVSNTLPSEQDRSPSAMSNHGLYVAGLIHAVAPDSHIHLYRVLNDDCRGSLFTLNTALHTFISETLAVSNTLSGAVINLSLGGHTAHYLGESFPALLEHAQAEGLLGELAGVLRDEVASLNTLLSTAQCHGIAVVAASGNDSYDKSMPAAPQIPASFSDCLDVAANNAWRDRACFSNTGGVAAPGGAGAAWTPCRPGVAEAGVECCTPALDECSDQDDCAYGVIGPVVPTEGFVSGYAYWAGTSFAAPLVSGLAALVLEASGGWQSTRWPSRADIPQYVSGAIRSGALDGIINVPRTLEQVQQ